MVPHRKGNNKDGVSTLSNFQNRLALSSPQPLGDKIPGQEEALKTCSTKTGKQATAPCMCTGRRVHVIYM